MDVSKRLFYDRCSVNLDTFCFFLEGQQDRFTWRPFWSIMLFFEDLRGCSVSRFPLQRFASYDEHPGLSDLRGYLLEFLFDKLGIVIVRNVQRRWRTCL